MFLSDRHGGVGSKGAQRFGKMRMNFLKLGGIKEEHAYATSGGAVVIAPALSKCRAPPYAIMTQIFAMVADVKVEPRASLEDTCDAVDKLIRVVHRVVIGVVDAFSVSSRIFEGGTGGQEGGGLSVVVEEGRVAAFVVDEKDPVLSDGLLSKGFSYERNGCPR